MTGEMLHFDTNAAPLGHIDHAERHHHRHAHFEQLRGQIEIPLQIGSIQDVDHHLGAILQDVLPGHGFIDRKGRKRVDTRQVCHVYARTRMAVVAFDPLDRHPRPVAHMLTGAGKGIEERRLAAVGIASDGNMDLVHDNSTSRASASSLRSNRLKPRS